MNQPSQATHADANPTNLDEEDPETVPPNPVTNEPTIAAKFDTVRERHDNHFKREDDNFVCTYCATKFNPLPYRGDVLANIQAHVNSGSHKAVNGGKKQQSLSSFFTQKAERKLDNNDDD